jgi:hypothetical protein
MEFTTLTYILRTNHMNKTLVVEEDQTNIYIIHVILKIISLKIIDFEGKFKLATNSSPLLSLKKKKNSPLHNTTNITPGLNNRGNQQGLEALDLHQLG